MHPLFAKTMMTNSSANVMMERSIEGLTTKVLNERLRKLTSYKIFQRHAYPEIPPRVEYCLTPFGEKFVGILDKLAELEEEVEIGEDDCC